ncbi:hypothetical protein [Rhodobacter sp. 24-YEA-8]|uniref:hypothetical protein n=1 Tax=Rhodobacter sp. 24-YEA-8 TaxID=1884310 RepID=UPI000B80D532|nr:hypothetical protein [Rhodobacter sp. 24-YEA-8]
MTCAYPVLEFTKQIWPYALELVRAVAAPGAAVWIATIIFRRQKQFERQSEAAKELRSALSEYLTLTKRLHRQRKSAQTADDLIGETVSELSQKTEQAYQYIRLFSTDPSMIAAAEALARADAKRQGAILLIRDAHIASLNPGAASLHEAEEAFGIAIKDYVDKVREVHQRNLGL